MQENEKKFLEEHYLEVYEEYSKDHPEEITSDFILEEDGNQDYIDEIEKALRGNKERVNEETINMCAEPNYEAIIREYEKQILEKEIEIERLNKALDVATEIINNKQKEIVRLNNIRLKALEFIYKELIPKNVRWDYDECIESDLPVERIKPLVDILELKEGNK